MTDSSQKLKEKSRELSAKLRKAYTPHFLRRIKENIFKIKSVGNGELELKEDELPLKTDMVVWLPLTGYQ